MHAAFKYIKGRKKGNIRKSWEKFANFTVSFTDLSGQKRILIGVSSLSRKIYLFMALPCCLLAALPTLIAKLSREILRISIPLPFILQSSN